MSNYDYRPELEEFYKPVEVPLEEKKEGEKQLKEIIKKLPEEEEDDSNGNDREAPPC